MTDLHSKIMRGAKESWKPLPGNPRYLISDMGRIKSLGRRKSEFRLMKPATTIHGYFMVCIYGGGSRKGRNRTIHSLVLETFVCPRPPKQEGCHLNGIKKDNRLSNLMWGTHHQNYLQAEEHGRIQRGLDHHNATLTQEQLDYIAEHYWARQWPNRSNAKILAAKFGVNRTTIVRAYKRIKALSSLAGIVGEG